MYDEMSLLKIIIHVFHAGFDLTYLSFGYLGVKS